MYDIIHKPYISVSPDCETCPDPSPHPQEAGTETDDPDTEQNPSSSVWFTTSVVCGSDGRSYPSQCHLRRAACQARKEIAVVRSGSCGGSLAEEEDKLSDGDEEIVARKN